MDRIEKLEANQAHLSKTIDELNEVVTAQATAIERLKTQVAFLVERARDAEAAGGIVIGDERPPHY
jgi:SlyX protein